MTNQLGNPGEPHSFATQDAARARKQTGWDVAKIVMEALSTVFSIALLALLAKSSTAFSEQSYFQAMGIRSFAEVVAAIIIFWNVLLFISMCATRRTNGFHPGVHVGVELILWLSCLACLAVSSTSLVTSVSDNAVTVTANVGVLFVLLFILFMRSCVEVDRHRKLKYAQEAHTGAQYEQRYEQQYGQQYGQRYGQQHGQQHEQQYAQQPVRQPVQQYVEQHWKQHDHQYAQQYAQHYGLQYAVELQTVEAPGTSKAVITKTEGTAYARPEVVPELQATTRELTVPVKAYTTDTTETERFEMAANEPWMNR